MHYKFSFILLIFFCGRLLGQHSVINSLQRSLSIEKTDSGRVKTLWKISQQYMSSRPDSALLAAQEGLFIARRTNNIEGEKMTIKQMADVYQFTGNYYQSLGLYLERLKLDEKHPDPERTVVTLISIANLYQIEGDYRNALIYARKGDSLISKNKLDDFKWYSYIGFADLYEKMDSITKAFFYNEQAYQLAKQQNDSAFLGMSLNNTANTYAKAGKMDTALILYFKGIPYLERTHNESFLCESYQGIASILFKKGSNDDAIAFAKRSLDIAERGAFDKKYMLSCNLLTNMYKAGNEIDSAFKYQGKMVAMKDSLYSLEKIKKLENLTIEEKLRQNTLEEQLRKDQEHRARNLQLLLIGVLIPFVFLLLVILSKRKIKAKAIEFAGILSLLLLFEYITLLLHPKIAALTHESPFLMILILVSIAAVLTPLHHRVEHWMLQNLTKIKKNIEVKIPDDGDVEPGVNDIQPPLPLKAE